MVVICPGRGSYVKETLGYLKKYHESSSDFIFQMDQERQKLSEITISELDQASSFNPKLHLLGENAASLIYTCAYSDYLKLDLDKYQVEAVIGNSMGWYIALAVAGVLNEKDAFHLVNTMGGMMKEGPIGAQVIYSVVDNDWKYSPQKEENLNIAVQTVLKNPENELYPSIHLGGYRLLAGNDSGVRELLAVLPKVDIYPFKLMGHGAFHTPLMQDISLKGKSLIGIEGFKSPSVSLIDGCGHIWRPHSTKLNELREYTLGPQVVAPYDFTLSLKVALKEFAPTKLILLGPGSTLGGSIGQILIELNWKEINSKSVFGQIQKQDPFLLAMGLDEQRKILLG